MPSVADLQAAQGKEGSNRSSVPGFDSPSVLGRQLQSVHLEIFINQTGAYRDRNNSTLISLVSIFLSAVLFSHLDGTK